MKTKKKVEHKHKWELEEIDCPFCGGGQQEYCECGEERLQTEKSILKGLKLLKKKSKSIT